MSDDTRRNRGSAVINDEVWRKGQTVASYPCVVTLSEDAYEGRSVQGYCLPCDSNHWLDSSQLGRRWKRRARPATTWLESEPISVSTDCPNGCGRPVIGLHVCTDQPLDGGEATS